jgi:nucleotide-binding universal stress UspA family protein
MKLLLPTDGSDYSEGAARFLTHLALAQDDEVTVLHVIAGCLSKTTWNRITPVSST